MMDSQFVPKIEKVTPSMLQITAQMLPAIRNWKVGETYVVQLEVEEVAYNKGKLADPNDQEDERAQFNVVSARSMQPEDQPIGKQLDTEMKKEIKAQTFLRAINRYKKR